MNSSAKQRIIGAFVLCAIGVIFFPLIFDLSGERAIDTTPTIPPVPEVSQVEIPEPQRPAEIIPPKSEQQAFQPSVNPEDAASEEPEPPALDENNLPEAWVIQVASFKEQDKAEELTKRLQQDGYKSYARSVEVAGNSVHRVFVGPKVLKQRALDEKQQIDKAYQLDTLVFKIQTMIWVDWVIVGILAVSAGISAIRGFVKEALSLAIWVVAIIVAGIFYQTLAPLLANLIETPSLRVAAAWLLIFVGVLILGAIVNYLLGQLVEATGLSGTDRLLGVLFGVARGAIIVMVVLIFLPDILPVEQDPWWNQSVLIPHFLRFENWAIETGSAVFDFFKQLF